MFTGLLISLFAALIPTLIHTMIFYWADRYEREPRWLLTVAFLWGAIPAIIASIIAEVALAVPIASSAETLNGQIVESSIIAPVVEEFCKGFALWVIFIWKRQEFDGVLDGLLYGALIGFGFAMTEDFFYYVGAFDEGGIGSLSAVIFLRAIIFGLNHGFYTGLTGIAFGLSRNMSNPLARFIVPWIGLGLAILAHALHNFGVTIAEVNAAGLLLSLTMAVGSIALLIIVVVLAWQHERRCVREELYDEIGTTLSADEFRSISERWRWPGLPARNGLLAELALHKYRLRQRGVYQEPELVQAIDEIRVKLGMSSV